MRESTSRLLLRLLSVGIAVALWFFISVDRLENESQRVVAAPVTFDTPDNLILLNPMETVNVRLKGKTRAVTSLNPQMVGVFVDLRDRTDAGSLAVRLGPDAVFTPDDLDVVTIDPEEITLELEHVDTTQVPLQARFLGEPAAGARVEEVRFEPDGVRITGPRSMVENITFLPVEINLNRRALSFEETLELVTPDPLILTQPRRVRTYVEMSQPELQSLGPAPAADRSERDG